MPITVLEDPKAAHAVPQGEAIVDTCRPMCIGLFDAGHGVEGEAAMSACASWLRDHIGWDAPVRSTLHGLLRGHRRGDRIALRCWCPDHHHAQAVQRVVLELADQPARRRGGQPGNRNAADE
jgi:hypothetical protein